MMKKHWLICLLICVLCILFSGCIPNGDNSSSSSGGVSGSMDWGDSSEDNPEYNLGEYENEIDEKWWADSSSEEDDGWNTTIPY